MGVQRLGPRRLRQLGSLIGEPVRRAWANGSYVHQFETASRATGWWNVGTGEWGWGPDPASVPPPSLEVPVDKVSAEDLETWMWVDRVMRRPHKPPATWTCRNVPLDRDRKPLHPTVKVMRQMAREGAGDYLSIGVAGAAKLLGITEDEVIERFRDDLLVPSGEIKDLLVRKEQHYRDAMPVGGWGVDRG